MCCNATKKKDGKVKGQGSLFITPTSIIVDSAVAGFLVVPCVEWFPDFCIWNVQGTLGCVNIVEFRRRIGLVAQDCRNK